ncbi:hypothetical protein ACSTK2_23310, partial [Vibrio parahaemolyticus]
AMIKPVMVNNDFDALADASNFSSFFPSGNFLEKKKKMATAANTPATIMYKVFTLVTVTSVTDEPTEPNKKKLTMIGPKVVP